MREEFTIGRVARRLGIRTSAVRFYERQGLVASERLPNGYRVYDREAVDVLRFINRAKVLGFSIGEIREILALTSPRHRAVRARDDDDRAQSYRNRPANCGALRSTP